MHGVHVGPPQIVAAYQQRQVIRSGESRRLTCPVESVPPPLITWQKDGETIHLGWDRFRTNEDSRVLRIKELEPTDSGVFICRATNGFGTVDVKYLIYVYGTHRSYIICTPPLQCPNNYDCIGLRLISYSFIYAPTSQLGCISTGIDLSNILESKPKFWEQDVEEVSNVKELIYVGVTLNQLVIEYKAYKLVSRCLAHYCSAI